jgi:hypothetical protein
MAGGADFMSHVAYQADTIAFLIGIAQLGPAPWKLN